MITKSMTALLFSASAIPTVWAQDYINPPMVNIPAGSFMMGLIGGEDKAKPVHLVTLPAFQMAKYPVTVAEYRLFVNASGYQPNQTCNDHMSENWFSSPDDDIGSASWDKHRFQKSEFQPVTCVNYQDATAYASWLSEKNRYTIPTTERKRMGVC